MLCNKCREEFKEAILGETNQSKETVKRVSFTPPKIFAFNNNFFPVYLTLEKEITKGKNKGQKKEIEEVALFKSNYCPRCGNKFETKTE